MKKSRIENQVSGPFEQNDQSTATTTDGAPTQRQSVIENRVEEISEAEEDYGTDEGVRVTAEQTDVSTNQQRIPIDPVTGKALPPIIDPLTGRIVHAKVDRESTVRAILDEEEQLEDEYEEIIEEEIIAHQTAEDLEMQEQEESSRMPMVRHTRMPDQDTRAKVANILNRNKSNLQNNVTMTQFKHDRQYANQEEQDQGDGQQTPFSQFNGGRRSYNQANVPPGFFEAQVDNPIEDRMRSQFGLPPNNLPQQRYQPGFGSHREGFQEDAQRFDQHRNRQFGINSQQQMPNVALPKEDVPLDDDLTPEQRAVFAKFSNQPHRFGMEPNLPEQVAAKRQADIAQYAAEQRNQLNQLANGVMPKVFSSHRVEPATQDDQGFDPVDVPHGSTKVPVIVSSPENSLIEMLRKGIRDDIRSTVRDEIREEMNSYRSSLTSSSQPMMMPQYQQVPQQQFCFVPQQQMVMQQQPQMMMPTMFVNPPQSMNMMAQPQVLSQPIIVQPIVMHQPPMMQQQYPGMGMMNPMMMNPYQNFGFGGQRFF